MVKIVYQSVDIWVVEIEDWEVVLPKFNISSIINRNDIEEILGYGTYGRGLTTITLGSYLGNIIVNWYKNMQ